MPKIALNTRAKFYCQEVALQPGSSAVRVKLSAVCRGDRNANWAQATPSGSMEMYINNPQAAKQWEEWMREHRENGTSPEVFIDLYDTRDGFPGDGHKFRPFEAKEGEYGYGTCGECGFGKDSGIRSERNPETGAYEPVGQAHPNG